MADQTIVNYELLSQFEKIFDTQQEETGRTISELRQKAQALESEWIGQAADKFFDEFYEELMPGMDRLRHACQTTAEVLKKVIRIFDEAENEGARYFREDSLEGGSSGIDVTGLEFDVFGGTTSESSGIDATTIDFDVFDGVEPDGSGGGGGQSDGGERGGLEPSPDQPSDTADQSQSAGMSAGGGGGGGSQSGGSEQQLRMGVGMGNQAGTSAQQPQAGSGGQMQDHIYEGNAGGGGQQSQNQNSPDTGAEGEAGQGGGILGAAGAAGGMAAAAGGIRKAGKRKKEDE